MRFVEATDTDQGLPPYGFEDVSIRMFVLEADIDCLGQYCDTFLNIFPDRYYFQPVLPYVYLGINSYPRMISLFPGLENAGYTRQNEFYFTFPAMRHDGGLFNIFLPAEFSWAFPFIGVDNPTSAFTGREVLGFPKHVGIITADTAADGSFASSVSMPAFKVIGDNEPQQELRLIDINTGPPRADTGELQHQFPWSLLNVDAALEGFDDAAKLMLELMAPGIMSVTNLKQFRDGEHPLEAAYQALVRCQFTLENMKPPVLFDQVDIRIWDDPTFPMSTALGLVGGRTPKPLMSIGMQADMVFGQVTNLCVAA